MSMPEPAERIITFSQAVNEALAEEMRREKTVFIIGEDVACLLYTSPSPRDRTRSRMPSSA